ncbi:hypothetical protein, partial [Streptosporangium sp. NPDC048865]|uniref:hypothetical protein n=1 Tax=Streptosporangium sp. NPDC048865 TaxID=3155766 RepID=UPI00342639A6
PVRGDVSTYYLGVNRGKRSIALNLRDETDAGLRLTPRSVFDGQSTIIQISHKSGIPSVRLLNGHKSLLMV